MFLRKHFFFIKEPSTFVTFLQSFFCYIIGLGITGSESSIHLLPPYRQKKALDVQIFNSEISIKKCISMYAISCGELLKRDDKQLTYFKFLFFIYIFMTFHLQFSKLVFLCLFTRSHSHSTQIVIHNSYLAVIICNNLTFHSQMHSLILLIKEISINSETT